MTTLFVLLASQGLAELSASELAWLEALRDVPSEMQSGTQTIVMPAITGMTHFMTRPEP